MLFLNLLRYVFGAIFLAYGLVCLLGGPEPELRGSVESYLFGFFFFAVGCLFFIPEIKSYYIHKKNLK